MALPVAGVSAVALAITGVLAFEWPFARLHDATILAGFRSLDATPVLFQPASGIVHAATPAVYVLIGAIFVAAALVRRQRYVAIAVPVAMAAAIVTTQLLKHAGTVRTSGVLPRYYQIPAPSWPSGHATAAMMVALSGVLIAPPALRPLAGVLGCAVALAVSYSILVLGWHYPSDVLGGFLVAMTWFSLLLAALRRLPPAGSEGWEPSTRLAVAAPSRRVQRLVAAVVLALFAAAGVVALARAQDHIGALVVGTIVLGLVSSSITAGTVTVLRQPAIGVATPPGRGSLRMPAVRREGLGKRLRAWRARS
jgi:membrane-associated phospholipid phosphatase